jgi:2-polyprenyl-3-methyl-5-hydroxy-6-metoxy-1,4-benzoquinol methylase
VSPDLRQRATDLEELDLGVPEAEARRSLGDLRLVNRWLGGRRALLKAVRPYLRPGARLLDVGCGSGDLPSWIAHESPGRLVVVGVDLKLLHLREAPPEIHRVVADVRALPFPPRSFDVVTASLFLHHFDAHEVGPILRALHGLCRRALVVNDLHRTRVPWLFARLALPLMLQSQVSVSDGLLSIRRAFTPRELRAAFREARIPARVERRFPYRLVAVAEAGA